jgi:TP901 family phage tail tape measure protein
MADAESNIIINVDTSIGISEIKNLQRQISELNAQLLKSGSQQAKAAQNIQRNLISNINATGKFAANVRTISSTAESFTTALEGNKLSMGQYFKYAGGATKTFGRLFKTEFNTIEKVATERVKTLQTQYIKLGRDANGALKAIAVRPLALDMGNLSTQTAMAAQKQQLFNQLVKQGSTNLLNFGKNTQWAGRQLMVGFTIPLSIMGSMAVKEFEKIEKQAIRFKRVYGDAFSSTGETEKALEDMRNMAREFTKYGIAVEKTLELAADAAQMGLSGSALSAQVTQATRLAVLGEVEQQEALQTTVSVMNAFGIAAEDLASKIDFLNAVENETVTAISDLTIAIPKAGPVVKQLGGSVEDLAFFLTAMKEGGINASEGANALKSGLASIINPAQKTKDMLNGLGISIDSIVEGNAGDIKGTVIGVATALDQLDPLNRARAIEQLFGKFQFSRISTLFQNVIKEGTQAQRVLELTKSSSEELAILSERELGKVEDSPLFKFQKAVEGLQDALAPIGKEFLKAITPVIEFGKTLLERFNSMSDGAKSFAIVATTVVAGIGPILLMTFGLVANGIANLIKMFAAISTGMRGAGTSSNDLALSTEYMTQQQLEAAAVASSLDQAHSKLVQTFSAEAGAVDRLAASYGRAIVAQSGLLNINPETGLPTPVAAKGGRRGPRPKKYNKGIVSVPGPKGAGDIVPAMLSPGEAVIPAKQSQKYAGLISGMVNDDIPGYRIGRNPFAKMKVSRGSGPSDWNSLVPEGSGFSIGEAILRTLTGRRGIYGKSSSTIENKLSERFLRSPGKKVAVRMFSDDLASAVKRGDKKYQSIFERGGTSRGSGDSAGGQRALAEEKLFGMGPDTPASKRPAYGYLFDKELQTRLKGPNLVERFTGKRDLNDRKDHAEFSMNRKTRLMNDDMYRYGDVAMILKNKALRGKTTITQGDSLNAFMNEYPTPANLRTRSRSALKSAKTSAASADFFEAQILGGFNFKDIKRIVATEPQTILKLQEAFQAAGIQGIRVGMPKYSMMQKLERFVYGAKDQPRLPRMQTEGRFAGTYRNDPLVINGKTYYNKGTEGVDPPSPRRYNFSQDRVLQSSHLAAEALMPEGQKVLTRKQMRAHVEKELAKGVRIGAFSKAESDVIKKRVFEQIAGRKFAGGGKLLSSQVGLTLADFNQKVRMGTPQPASQINSWLKKQPLGMFGGSTLLSTRAGVRGDFSDDLVRSYSQDLESSISRRLGSLGKAKLDESGFHKIFKAAQVEAEGRIQDLKLKEKVKTANRTAALQINPAIPGTGRQGATRKFALNNVQEAAHLARPELAKIFKYRDNFLSKNSVILPGAARDVLSDKFIDGLTTKQRDHLESALSKVDVNKFKNPSSDAQFAKIVDTFKANPNSTAGQLSKAARDVLATPPSSPKRPAGKPKAPKMPAGKTPAPPQARSFSLSKILGRGMGVAGVAGMLASTFGGMFQDRQYNSGVVSVPGPKGKGDVVPAMLTPGEAVIPAGMSKKYAPLISGMINDNIPGYSEGLQELPPDPFGNPQSRNSQSKPVIDQKAASTMGTTIGKVLGKSKGLVGALANVTSGVSQAAKDMVQSNIQEKMLKKMGPGLGGAIKLKDGRIFDQVAGKSYMDEESYQMAQKAIRDKKVPGSRYATPTGQVYGFDEEGRAKRVLKSEQAAVPQQAVSEKQPKQKGSIAGKMAGASGIAGMGAMMYGMSGGPGAEIASMASMPLMMAPMLMPLLANPVGATIAALAAVAAGAFLIKGHFDKLGAETRKSTEAMGVGTSAMQKFAEFSGNVSASELMNTRRAGAFSPFSIAAGKNEFGASFLQSEDGQSLLSTLKSARTGGQDVGETMFNQLSAAVSGGSLGVDQARSIAYAMAETLGDSSIGLNINANLTSLFGPEGENLLKDPLKIQIEQISRTDEDLSISFSNFEEAIDVTFEEFDQLARDTEQKIEDDLNKTGWGWVNTAIDIAGNLNPINWVARLVTGDSDFNMLTAVAGTIGAGFEQATISVEATNAYIVKAASAIQNYQSAVDALDVNYDKQIEAARAAGDEAKLQELINKKAEERNQIMLEYGQAVSNVRKSFDESSEGGQEILLTAATDRLLEKFEGDDQTLFKAAAKALEGRGVSKGNQFELKMLLNADAISLSAFDWISSNLSDDTITRVLNLDTKLTGKDLGTMTSLLSRFGSDRTRQEFITKFELATDATQASDILGTFTEIANLADTLGTEKATGLMDFFVDPANEAKVLELRDNIKELKEFDGEKITIEYLQEVYGGEEFANIIKSNYEYFDGLDKNQQIKYTQIIETMILGTDPMQLQQDAIDYAARTGKNVTGPFSQDQLDQFIMDYLNWVAEWRTRMNASMGVGGEETPNPGGPEKKDPFLNILSRLKEIRDAAINASGGIEQLRDALAEGATASTKFVGIEQQLLFAGYGQEFISSIRGMDEETRKEFISINNGVVKVTEAGKLMNKAYSEITLGDFQFSVASGVAAVNKQTKAMGMLVDAGMSVADAYEVVQNEALAHAIATEADAEEVEDLVGWLERLRKKQEELKLSTPEGIQDWLQDYQGALSSATSKVSDYFSAQRAVADEDFFSGTNISGRNVKLFNMDAIMDQIDESNTKLDTFKYNLGNLEYDLSSITSQEDLINKKYDERLEALDKVLDANSDIADQQKSQLDVVSALSSGDIAAAARAVQENRAREADRQAENRKAAIERQRELELQGLRSTGGKTRKELEDEILDLTNKINKEQAENLVPAERRLSLAQQARDVALEAIGEEGYLGKTEKGWAAIENAARLAVVQSDAFRLSLINILKTIPGITFDAEGNVKFDPKVFGEGIKTGTGATGAAAETTPDPKPSEALAYDGKNSSFGVVAAAREMGTIGDIPVSKNAGVIDKNVAAKAANLAVNKGGITAGGVTIKAASTADFATQVMDQVLLNRQAVNSGNLSAAEVKALTKQNVDLMTATGLRFAGGGMVPDYKRMGGLIPYKRMGGLIPYKANGGLFQSINTDTVPAMLTPGEFVIRRHSVQKYGTDKLSSINNGTYNGESVYNYSVNVNVKSDSNPDQIAQAVMTQIRQVDSMRLRGNKF